MNLPFAVLDIDHVVLRAQDPAALEQFYTEVLGCPLDLRQKHIQLTQLRAGRAQIDIVPAMASDSERPAKPSVIRTWSISACGSIRLTQLRYGVISIAMVSPIARSTTATVQTGAGRRSIWKIRKAIELSSRGLQAAEPPREEIL